jgi:predicted MFS family arabinose efflux permease
MTNSAPGHPVVAFILLLSGTMLGIAGTDLVLPAVPSLPAALGGSHGQAQLVLAAFVGGSAIGHLLFGELGAHFNQKKLLVGSLVAYGTLSGLAAYAPSLTTLVILRILQGAAGSAAAVFAPGFIRALFDETRAIRALGLLGSIESLVPALAPIAGAWLLLQFGWRSSFMVTAALALLVATALIALRRSLPEVRSSRRPGGYLAFFRDPVYLRYALSQAFSLGGILVFVFGLPTVLVETMGGSITDFIIVQVTGIAFFILGANVASRLAKHFGTERMIMFGTAMSAAGHLAVLAYALAGGGSVVALALLSTITNLGFGLRGPPGFFRAIQASHGDDARGSALVILGILLTTAAGTAALAPFITWGLPALTLASGIVAGSAVICLLVLPKLSDAAQ